MKRLIVLALVNTCDHLDRLPGRWGCRVGLAGLSDRLDRRWQTGVWT